MKTTISIACRALPPMLVVGLVTATGLAANVPEAFFAEYQYSGGQSELQELQRELDRVANQFAEIIRPIARQKLRDRIGPYRQVEFERGDAVPVLTLGTQPAVPCDGGWHAVSNERGEEGRLTCFFRDATVEVTTEYDQGSRAERIDFGASGEVVRIRSVVSSPKLPDEIRFQLSYEPAS